MIRAYAVLGVVFCVAVVFVHLAFDHVTWWTVFWAACAIVLGIAAAAEVKT